MITPPVSINTYSQSALRALSVALLAALPLTVSAAEGNKYEWIGQVDGNGNSGVSLGADNVFDNFYVIVGGTPPSYWNQAGTTEAVILNNQSLTVAGTVRVENTTSHDALNNNGGIRLQSGSSLTLSGESVRLVSIGGSHSTNESVAITVADLLTKNTVDITAKTVQIIGDIENRYLSGNNINITFSGSDSYWYGSEVLGVLFRGTNITLADGATWIYDADNESGIGSEGYLNNLNLEGGVVILDDQIIDEKYSNTVIENEYNHFTLRNVTSTEVKHTAVTISRLTGTGGTFQLDLDWRTNQGQKTHADDGTSDFINIGTVVDEGSHQFVSFDQSKAHLDEMNVGDKLYFAGVGAGTTTFTTNADGEKSSADELYSFNYSTQSEVDANTTYWFLTKSLGRTNENTTLLKSAALASYSLASDLDRFNERRGQSRHAERGASGPWVRYQFSSLGLDDAFDMDKHMIQVGYDADVSNSESRKIVGVAFDYTRGDTDIDSISATGDNDRYGLNFYYTVLADCGGYADFNAKIGRIGSDYDAHNSSGESIGADFWQTYYGLSAEFGYKHDFTSQLFVEPQAQMQVMRIEGADFTTDGGVRAHFENANSLIGRVGVRAGYEFSFAESLPASSIYVVADVLREFNGDTTWRAVGRSTSYVYDENGHETWYDAGIGADLSVNRNTNLWLDTKYVFGGDFENTWSLNAGVRWMF